VCTCLSVYVSGYNIGVRLIDEFLAKSNMQTCVNFRETAQVVAKVTHSRHKTHSREEEEENDIE
jgi:uncharacterized protein YjaZ